MALYCTLPRGGGSYYHSSIHSPSESGSGSSPSSSSSTITSDSSSILTRQGTIGSNYNHSINPRYQHLQSIKTMFNNINSIQQQQQQGTSSSSSHHNNENLNSEDKKSLINTNNHCVNYQDYQQQYNQKIGDVSSIPSLKNYQPIESPVTPGLSSPQGNQFNQLVGLSNSLNIYNNNINDSSYNVNTNTGNNSTMNSNQQQQQRQSLQLTLPRPPPEPPQRIYYGLNNFDDLKQIRRNSITSLFDDPPTPNFYGDEDSAYDSTSNESLRLTVKELSKRSNSKKYFTLPTKLGRRLRKSSCPEFNKDHHQNNINNNNQGNNNNTGTLSSTPSPVSDCSPSPKLIFNGPTFPPSVSSSKPTLLTSSSISSSSSSPTSSISPPSIVSSSLSSSPSSSSTSDVSVSSTVLPPSSSSSSASLVTEMSYSSPQQLLHNHHVENCVNNQNNYQPSSSSTSTPTSETINSSTPIIPSPSANENVCHCCYLLGCHTNQNSTITQSNTAHYQQHGRVNPGGVGINNTNNIPSTGQPSTLETLWEEPSSGHESVRLTEEAIYAAMRELNISLPSKDSVNGQANRNGNSSSWLRANFLKAFRRSSSSKNRSSKLISNNSSSNNNNNSNNSGSNQDYREKDSIDSRRGSLIMSQDNQNNYPSHLHHHHHHQQHDNHHTHQQSSSSCYSDEISSKRTSSGPSVASSLVSLPLSCSSSVPPTPPLTPLPSYHSYQHHNHQQQQQHQHQSQLQLQIHDNQQHSTLTTSHIGTEEDVIKELNRQLAEKDQLLQEVCMESINHLNTIESLKELVAQLRQEIDSLNNQNDQQNAKYSTNSMDKLPTDYNEYRSNQMQVNQLTNRNCA
ncbi:putative uncharacterized protein DDB_G0277255 isoform X3 [Panonychus citri]|nr:putative uncharacterized protein DDB_G0277255 isoform X3 [Panonychus citri]XP_053209572.1 putative uncharacterized protein DDB_G0277255 isoform X3 [Panonychus citri]XP_053209573.1 putative uncharacterized protein DDB_G0277255 isoform X3 [Panonychus citri]XP_053209574.1 putative uncharacterized protein DDB_G0277255 isoform X3 [Panonychus citri]